MGFFGCDEITYVIWDAQGVRRCHSPSVLGGCLFSQEFFQGIQPAWLGKMGQTLADLSHQVCILTDCLRFPPAVKGVWAHQDSDGLAMARDSDGLIVVLQEKGKCRCSYRAVANAGRCSRLGDTAS